MQGHPYFRLIQAIENPAVLLPLGRMISDLRDIPHEDLDQLVPILDSSFRHALLDLRRPELATTNVNPWVALRAAAAYSSFKNCLANRTAPLIEHEIDPSDQVVQALAAVAWIKYIKLVVIPVLKQFHSDAGADESEPWQALILLMETGVESLVKSIVAGRSDVSVHVLLTLHTF